MTLGMVKTSCYLIWNKNSKETLLVDPTDNATQVEKVIRERDLSLKALLLIHGHFGHVLAAPTLQDVFQVPLCATETETETLRNPELNSDARWLRQELLLKADRLLHDREKLFFLGTEVEVLFTPGYTASSCCYHFPAEKLLFSGDTLFEDSLGHVDLSDGNMASLRHSLDHLLKLPADTLVLPGRMGQISIGEERKSNPIFHY